MSVYGTALTYRPSRVNVCCRIGKPTFGEASAAGRGHGIHFGSTFGWRARLDGYMMHLRETTPKTDGPSSGDRRRDGDGYAHETSAVFGSCIVCARWRVVRARARGRPEHRDGDNRRLECGICRWNVDVRAIGERVPQAGRSLRQTGPGH